MKAICSWEIESNVAVKRPRVNVLKGNIAKEKESPVVLFIAERDRGAVIAPLIEMIACALSGACARMVRASRASMKGGTL